MLIVTEAAAQVVKSFTANPQAPEGSGLRIASSAPESGTPEALRVTAAAGPDENDQVIETSGARVYLEQQAAVFLDDKVLDAQVDGEGKAHFFLGTQSSDQV